MSKEMQVLEFRKEFYKSLINVYKRFNFDYKTNRYVHKIEQYQNKLSYVYKRIQELKEEEE